MLRLLSQKPLTKSYRDITPGASMVRVCRQAEFLKLADALKRWAEARDRAVAALEGEAGHLDRKGLADQALRLRSAALHLRQTACEEHLRAARLRAATAVHRGNGPLYG